MHLLLVPKAPAVGPVLKTLIHLLIGQFCIYASDFNRLSILSEGILKTLIHYEDYHETLEDQRYGLIEGELIMTPW